VASTAENINLESKYGASKVEEPADTVWPSVLKTSKLRKVQ
jgi:hypothetical protein